VGRLERGGPRLAHIRLHALAEFLHHLLGLLSGIGLRPFDIFENARPLFADLLCCAVGGLPHRIQELVFEPLQVIQHLFQLRLLVVLSGAGQLLERDLARLRGFEQSVVHSAQCFRDRLFHVDVRTDRAHVHAFGDAAHDLLDLRERELAALQRLQGQIPHRGAQILALLHRFAGHLLQQLIGVEWIRSHNQLLSCGAILSEGSRPSASE
jgi:hypothetical protein